MPLQAEPKFTWKFDPAHCPRNPAQDLQCVGLVTFWAYLHVTGQEDFYVPGTPGTPATPTSPGVPPTNAQIYSNHQVSREILPIRVEIPFAVDFDTRDGDYVKKCDPPDRDNRGPEPLTTNLWRTQFWYPLKFERPQLPAVDYDEKGKCLSGAITFKWRSKIIGASTAGAASGSVSGTGHIAPLINPSGSINASGQASASVGLGGDAWDLEVTFSICYTDGCQVTVRKRRTGAADAVYDRGGDQTIP